MPPSAELPPPETDAFAGFLAGQRPAVVAFLRRLCGADAEDLAQEALARAWRSRASCDLGRNPSGWLLQTAFAALCDHRNRQRRQPAGAGDAAELPAPRQPCRLELREQIERSLANLAPLERTLLLGFHAEGRTLQELAEQHQLPLNTVKSHLHRARARLAVQED